MPQKAERGIIQRGGEGHMAAINACYRLARFLITDEQEHQSLTKAFGLVEFNAIKNQQPGRQEVSELLNLLMAKINE